MNAKAAAGFNVPHLMKRIIVILILVAGNVAMGSFIGHRRWQQKSTGPAVLQLKMGSSFWFARPNGEVFEMFFDNPPPFQPGMRMDDITYTDDNESMRHFLKATFPIAKNGKDAVK